MRDAGVVIDTVVEVAVDDEEIVVRMSGRRVHPASGRVYHVVHNPPRVEGRDDETGEELVQRADDREETVRTRLAVYREQTQPLVELYQGLAEAGELRYARIDGVGDVERIRERTIEAVLPA